MTSNTIVKDFLYKISQKVSETNKKKQILDDMKNAYNHDENANYTITLICGYVIYVYILLNICSMENLLSVFKIIFFTQLKI